MRCYVITCQNSESSHFEPNNKHNPNKSNELVLCLFSALENDPDLVKMVKVWPDLPEHIRQAIKSLVQTHKAENK
jgi:hypothetical protein